VKEQKEGGRKRDCSSNQEEKLGEHSSPNTNGFPWGGQGLQVRGYPRDPVMQKKRTKKTGGNRDGFEISLRGALPARLARESYMGQGERDGGKGGRVSLRGGRGQKGGGRAGACKKGLSGKKNENFPVEKKRLGRGIDLLKKDLSMSGHCLRGGTLTNKGGFQESGKKRPQKGVEHKLGLKKKKTAPKWASRGPGN